MPQAPCFSLPAGRPPSGLPAAISTSFRFKLRFHPSPVGASGAYSKTLTKNTRSRKLRHFPTRPYLRRVMKKHITLKSKINSAFSLVELLVVIAVIAVIAAIAIPNIAGTRQAAVDAQEDYDQATVDRLLGQALAAGATSDGTEAGTDPTADALRAGTTFTTPEGVAFSLTGASTQ